MIDVFSRYVTGWMVAERESAELAKHFIEDTLQKHTIPPGQLTIHADRGKVMRSKPVAFLMADLGIAKTHSRPYVSNDNPYSESQFRTRAFCQQFFTWYNDQHCHSGIALLTPSMVHFGQAPTVLTQRQLVLDAAYLAHPERFVRRAPNVQPLPGMVWINKPVSSDSPERNTH
jgi:putative transposase